MFINLQAKPTRWLSGKESTYQCRSCKRFAFDPWIGNILWRREWLPTPLFLPGKFHGQRSLVGYSPWDCKESDTAEQLTPFTFTFASLKSLTPFLALLPSHPLSGVSFIAPALLTWSREAQGVSLGDTKSHRADRGPGLEPRSAWHRASRVTWPL